MTLIRACLSLSQGWGLNEFFEKKKCFHMRNIIAQTKAQPQSDNWQYNNHNVLV